MSVLGTGMSLVSSSLSVICNCTANINSYFLISFLYRDFTNPSLPSEQKGKSPQVNSFFSSIRTDILYLVIETVF